MTETEDHEKQNIEDNAFEHTALSHGFRSSWEVEDVSHSDLATPHPFVGVKTLVYRSLNTQPTRKNNGKHRVPIPGDTWLDIWKASDAAIIKSGDTDPIFIEMFDVRRGELVLYTGS